MENLYLVSVNCVSGRHFQNTVISHAVLETEDNVENMHTVPELYKSKSESSI